MALPGPPPHGGHLVDLRTAEGRVGEVAQVAGRMPGWELSRRQRCDLELLATGGFSPLRTFLDRADHESVCSTMRLTTGELWPVPITLDLPEHVVDAATSAGGLVLRARGVDVAILRVTSAWRPDRRAEAAAVLGTTDPTHPGVQALIHESHPWYVSGPLEVLQLPPHHAFRALRHTPAEVRSIVADRGWDRVVAFQTRNPMHRAHQELSVRAARELGASLLLHPVVGVTKPGDVDPYVRVRCYRALLPTYPPDRVLLSLLPLAMLMAGPREALWHAIVRKNYGATHFIVGRDHAGPGEDQQGRPFYEPYAAQELVHAHERELGIGVVPFRQMVYVEELGTYVPEDELQPDHHPLRISGTEQRRRLAEGEELPAWFTPPEVAAELRRAFPPRYERGVCVLMPDATSAALRDRAGEAVAARLREAGRTVTRLSHSVPDEEGLNEEGLQEEGLQEAGPTRSLVAHLMGEVMRNGGVVVCSVRLVAALPGAARSQLAEAGVVLEVRMADDRAQRALGESGEQPWLVVPDRATPETVADAVHDHLRTSGYLRAVGVTRDRGPAGEQGPPA